MSSDIDREYLSYVFSNNEDELHGLFKVNGNPVAYGHYN